MATAGTIVSFNDLLDKYRKDPLSEHDKGAKFERLMQAYLQTDPKYAGLFKHAWLWSEFFGRGDFGGNDIGIDLVAETMQGDYWAIQCKCFQEDSHIDKKAVDSFLATSSKQFKNEQLRTVSFAHRLWISTTNKWGANAEEAIKGQKPPVSRINLYDLQEAPVDWGKLEKGISGKLARAPGKELFPHQRVALKKAHEYYQKSDRGKLIMACGTGKTFAALRIAEKLTDGDGLILLLVPSIALMSQTLREWSADAKEPINAICICSDAGVSKKTTNKGNIDGYSTVDLALPASTNVKSIIAQFESIRQKPKAGMTVVFSTYQSIEVIAKAQKQLFKEKKPEAIFDLVICDEAHRTTGVTLADEDSSAFVKVHDNNFIQARKRMYMTATPRLYSDDSKARAAQSDAVLCSMDDPKLYGEEFYRIGFGQAVEEDMLSDYKVLILTLDERDVPQVVQNMIADNDSEINTDDASKLIGCINALSKQVLGDEGLIKKSDPDPMQRAVAFCQTIKDSKKITHVFNSTQDVYLNALSKEKRADMVSIAAKHVDGTMSAPARDELLGWLKSSDDDQTECRVLTNVRCLSEGVDVPSLDSVMFLSARNSQVDVVQSVGRVMRKSPGKKYGYIIIPVIVPSDEDPSKALDKNERYKVVWSVLNALRAHDDRFNATINKIDLNKTRPNNILIGKPGGTDGDGDGTSPTDETKAISQQLALQFERLQSVVYARMVEKVGDRRYWEQWAKDVAEIAERQIARITGLVKKDGKHKKVFEKFLKGLQKNMNPSVTEAEAIEMLAQHVITQPVFEALFQDYSFVNNNPISKSMQTMLALLEAQAIEKDTETLDKFYASVRKRAEGIDNAEGKQRIIIELYDKFFKTAFPRMVEKLGIVYTPVEVVDFIIHSVNDVLQKEFGRSLSDENIHIIDPFVGTGTFITRLLQSGLIKKADLKRKYTREIHANEIVLLAYYIAAVNIENAYHDITEEADFVPFEGICLTDTFQLGESDPTGQLISEVFPQNSKRVTAQKKAPLRVIMGNPPYSIGQKSANDNAQNQSYPKLAGRIAQTYVAGSSATQKRSNYDSYIKAFRWSTDRLDPKNGGVIAFVSNGAWLDGNAQDGFRKCLVDEFSAIYVFNLRGNARTQGEVRRKEAGNVFGSGSRNLIAITLLVKKPGHTDPAEVRYHDIGDYLKREEKLVILGQFKSIDSPDMPLTLLTPDRHGDWLNKQNSLFDELIPIGDKKDKKNAVTVFEPYYSNGLKTNRDVWVYGSSSAVVQDRMEQMIDFYNQQVAALKKAQADSSLSHTDALKLLDNNPREVSWSDRLRDHAVKQRKHNYGSDCLVCVAYRPFFKQRLYRHKPFIERPGKHDSLFPAPEQDNRVICVPAPGGNNELSAIMTDAIPDLHLNGDSQCFPLYYYEETDQQNPTLFDAVAGPAYVRRDGITDFIFEQAKQRYGKQVTKEDIFYYVYGLLHSPNYGKMFANDLKKTLPRIPLVEEPRDFWKFSKAGRALADLHIGYEDVPPAPGVTVTGDESGLFTVEKMRFRAKGQKDTIIFNSRITVSDIPDRAYEYIVNGKSAIEWVMERYKVTVDKESGIKNDPSDWAAEVGNPRYILDLLLSVINLSVQTMDIVDNLPKLTF